MQNPQTLRNPFFVEGPMLLEAIRSVVRNSADWTALRALYRFPNIVPPAVDFEKEMVLVAATGLIYSSGPRLIVGALREEADGLVATAHRLDSPTGDVGWGDSAPGDAVVVARDPRPIRWADRAHRYGLPSPFPVTREQEPALIHLNCHPTRSPAEPFRAAVRSVPELHEMNGLSPSAWHPLAREGRSSEEPLGRGMLLVAGMGQCPDRDYEILILDVHMEPGSSEIVAEVHTYEPILPRPSAHYTPPLPTTPADMVIVPHDPRPVRWEFFHHLR